MRTNPPRSIAGAAAVLVLALLPEVGSLRAESTHALTLSECLRESLSANPPLLVRSAESAAAGGRLAAEQNASRLLAVAALGEVAFARQALAVRVVTLYEDALALRAVLCSLDQSHATLTAQVERIDAVLRPSKAAEVDRLRVRARLARVEQGAIEAHSRLELANAEAGFRAVAARIEASRLAVEQAQGSLRIEQRKEECARKTMERAGLGGFAHLPLERDFHFEKGATRATVARIRQVAERGADLLANQPCGAREQGECREP